jgi:hypothetical protein
MILIMGHYRKEEHERGRESSKQTTKVQRSRWHGRRIEKEPSVRLEAWKLKWRWPRTQMLDGKQQEEPV